MESIVWDPYYMIGWFVHIQLVPFPYSIGIYRYIWFEKNLVTGMRCAPQKSGIYSTMWDKIHKNPGSLVAALDAWAR
jgi:hypothetical protein